MSTFHHSHTTLSPVEQVLNHLKQEDFNAPLGKTPKFSCEVASCRSRGKPMASQLALTHVADHFNVKLPDEMKKYWCPFCETTDSPYDIAKHCEANHNPPNQLWCDQCCVTFRSRSIAAHDVSCPKIIAKTLSFRKWNHDTYQYDYTYEKLRVLLVVSPGSAIHDTIDHVRGKKIELERYKGAKHQAEVEGTILSWKAKIEEMEEEFRELTCPRLLPSRPAALYFPTSYS